MDVKEIKTFCLMLDKDEVKKLDACMAFCNVELTLNSTRIGGNIKSTDVSYFRSKFQELLEKMT